MPNMSYCRFRNTANDLDDALEHMDELIELGDPEIDARLQLIKLCVEVAEDYGHEVEE